MGAVKQHQIEQGDLNYRINQLTKELARLRKYGDRGKRKDSGPDGSTAYITQPSCPGGPRAQCHRRKSDGREQHMSVDTAHSVIAATALVLLAGGAALAWGVGYGLLLTGTVLMAGVIYARTR